MSFRGKPNRFNGNKNGAFQPYEESEEASSFDNMKNQYGPIRGSAFGSSYGPTRGSDGYEREDKSTLGSKLQKKNWSEITLQPFEKNFYNECESVKNMTNVEVEKWRRDNHIAVHGINIPKPIRTFEEAGFPEYLMKEIRHAGFPSPTPIQSQGWPMAMSGRDVIGIASTGSGKTLAFLLPSIIHINAQPPLNKTDGPITLIVVPTRELAIQIETEANKFIKNSGTRFCAIYGGVPRKDQYRKLCAGVSICICTPGRLIDFIESDTTNLHRVTYLVIDEADRMLDMGFEPQLKSIMSQIRVDRQVLMWSATWPKQVQKLARNFMNEDTIQVTIGQQTRTNGYGDEVCVANKNVEQIVYVIQNNKDNKLYDVIKEHINKENDKNETENAIKEKDKKILIFTSTKGMCNELAYYLQEEWFVSCLHGDKQQSERERALRDFKDGKTPIMVATDVASRGIHVDDISLVINYDFPSSIEDYIHRIGRTARCGKKGVAVSFITRNDARCVPKLIQILKEAKQTIPNELTSLCGRGAPRGNYYRGYGW